MIYHKINPTLHRLDQVKVLDIFCKFLAQNPDVKALISRGSIAKGLSDKLSDIDLVIVTKNEIFKDFMVYSKLRMPDQIIRLTEDSWVDSNVPNFGGIGYVDLIQFKEKLLQMDTYIVPEENFMRLNNLVDKKILYQKGKINFINNVDVDEHRFKKDVVSYENATSESFQILFDVILHFFMLYKYIVRKDAFLSYKYWYLLNAKYLSYLRTCLDSNTRDFNFYDIHRQLDNFNSHELLKFEKFLTNPPKNLFHLTKLSVLFSLFESTLKKYSHKTYKEHNLLIVNVRNYISKTVV